MAESGGKSLETLSESLADHSLEGVELLTAVPSRLIRATIAVISGLLLAAFAWSFVGRADVIVSAPGRLAPESEERRFYAPVGGELVDLYVAEGQPVQKGDVLARINARDAIQLASNAMDADLRLNSARREAERFADKKALTEKRIRALNNQIAIARRQHEKRVAEGMAKISQAQRARLEEARGALEKARSRFDIAQRELAKYERLYNQEGGGGVSRNQVENLRSELVVAEADYKLAEARLGELDYLLSQEYAEMQAKVEGSDSELVQLEIERDAMINDLQREEQQVQVNLRRAELEAEVAARISFDNFDQDNFLRISAPVDGVVTQVAHTQRGDKIQPSSPLGAIAPRDARPVLELEIHESDRAFLQVGQSAKIKFNAFPYQRYGFLQGRLEYVSPSTRPSERQAGPVYRGRVSLEQAYFEVDGERLPLRFGMEAKVEIVVRERRIIDLALDPFRKLKG